jgi:hypothetical protein
MAITIFAWGLIITTVGRGDDCGRITTERFPGLYTSSSRHRRGVIGLGNTEGVMSRIEECVIRRLSFL